jgi:hypothetical protein
MTVKSHLFLEDIKLLSNVYHFFDSIELFFFLLNFIVKYKIAAEIFLTV